MPRSCAALHEPIELGLARDARVELARRDRPVAVVARVRVAVVAAELAFGVLVEGREPERVHAERLDVAGLDGLSQARERTARAIGGLGRWRERTRIAAEAIEDDLVDDRVARVPGVRLDPDGGDGLVGLDASSVAGTDRKRVLSTLQTGGLESERARLRVGGGDRKRDALARRDDHGGRVEARAAARGEK